MSQRDLRMEDAVERRIWAMPLIGLAAVLLLFGGLLAGQLFYLRQDHLADARREAEDRALVVAQHAARTIEGGDMMLRTIAAVFAGMETPLDPGDRHLHELLASLSGQAPAIRSVLVLDEQGRLTHDAGAFPARVLDAGQRDYFTQHRGSTDAGLFIGRAIKSRLSGRWTITLSRKLTDREGRFAGVVVAGLEPDYLDAFYGSLRQGPAGHLALWHTERRLVARHPFDEAFYERPADTEADRVWSTLAPAPHGIAAIEAGPGFGASFAAYHRVEDYPLVATVVTRKADALADWNRLVFNLSLGYLLFALAAAAVTALVVRQHRGRAELARFREEAASQFRRQFIQSNDAQFLARDGRLLDCNAAAIRLFRAPDRETLLSRRADSIWAEHLADGTPTAAVKEEQKAIARQSGFHRFAWRGRRLDGEEFPAEVTLTPVTSEPQGTLLAVWRDLTAEQSQAKALGDNLALLDTTFRTLSQGIAVFDGERRLVASNRQLFDLLDIPEELSVLGTPFEAFARYVAARGEYGPGDPDVLARERTDLAFSGRLVTFERARHDGRILSGTGQPMPGGGLLNAYADITDLARAREAALTAEARLRSAVEALDAAFVVLDAEDRLVLCNSRYLQFLGLTPDQAKPGMTFRQILRVADGGNVSGLRDPDLREERIERRVARLRSGEGPFEVPLHDGRIMLASDRVMADGSIVGLRTDITQQKRQAEQLSRHVDELETSRSLLARQTQDLSRLAEEYAAARTQAEAANAAKTQFLAVMSHEMRTPLGGVMGMLELLASSRLDTQQAGWVKAGRESADLLLAVIDDVLDVAKLEAGRIELESVDFAVDPLVEAVCGLLSTRARAAGVTLSISRDPALPRWLRGDPTRVRQVLLNLVGNAVKFTQGGRVSVGLGLASRDGAERVRIEVADTGIGIPEHALSRIFDRFTQADLSTTRRFGGSGLGLSICRQLVALMGGEIGVTSTLGQGSRFWFEIPLSPGQAPAAAVAGAPRRSEVLPPLKILLAEDNAINQILVRSMLENAGHRVSVVADGAQAVAAVQKDSFDIVLMDGHMPVMDGIGATRAIRALPPPLCALPVIAVTADALSVDRERYLDCGMNDIVTKPIDFSRLFAVMARALAGEPAESDAPQAGPRAALIDETHLAVLRDAVGAEGLRELLAVFPGGLDNALAAIGAAGDLAAMAREAHTLKGLAGNLGAVAVAEIAGRIEAAARTGSAPAAMLDDLRQAVAETRAVLAGL